MDPHGDAAAGGAVPLGSHIRRMNPCDTAANVNRRRNVRRGATYGPPLPDDAPDDGEERGIAAVVIGASIIRQFEFAQNVWANDTNFHELGNERDLRYALGRQVGRIRFGHTRAAILLGGAQSTLPSILGWAGSLRDVLFAWYRRMQVLTADRCGAVACAGTGTAVRAEVKLSVGAAQLDQVRPDDLLR